MTTEECYASMGGDYEDVLRRLGNEDRVKRFLGRFIEDDNFSRLHEAIAGNRPEEAFRAAHSIKGICLNLGLTALLTPVCDLTEALRDLVITPAADPLLEQVSEAYRAVVRAVEALQNEDEAERR